MHKCKINWQSSHFKNTKNIQRGHSSIPSRQFTLSAVSTSVSPLLFNNMLFVIKLCFIFCQTRTLHPPLLGTSDPMYQNITNICVYCWTTCSALLNAAVISCQEKEEAKMVRIQPVSSWNTNIFYGMLHLSVDVNYTRNKSPCTTVVFNQGGIPHQGGIWEIQGGNSYPSFRKSTTLCFIV